MKEIALESLMADTILFFCEHAVELGCPMNQKLDIWFRNRTDEEREDLMDRLLEIQEQVSKENEEQEDKEIVMREITLNLDPEIIQELLHVARSEIVNDEQALINYGANLVLKEYLGKEGVG